MGVDFGISELAIAGLATTAVGAGVSAYGAYQQGQAESKAAEYQAAVARNNQIVANQYAQSAIQQGNVMEQNKRLQTAQREGAIRATIGGSGLNLDSGSPLRLQSDTALTGELDAQMIRYNAQQAAYGYKTQGVSFANQAGLLESRSKYASEAGELGAFTSLVGGASSISDKWAKYKQVGVFG